MFIRRKGKHCQLVRSERINGRPRQRVLVSYLKAIHCLDEVASPWGDPAYVTVHHFSVAYGMALLARRGERAAAAIVKITGSEPNKIRGPVGSNPERKLAKLFWGHVRSARMYRGREQLFLTKAQQLCVHVGARAVLRHPRTYVGLDRYIRGRIRA